MNIKRHRRTRPWLLIVLLVGVGGIVGAFWHVSVNHHVTPASRQPTSSDNPATVTDLNSRLLITGDVFWGRYINQAAQASSLKTAYPFSQLSSFNRSDYDAWIGDMECPVTDGPTLSIEEQEATLTFNCSPDYLPEAAKWFTAMSLANNHSDNEGGQDGVATTRKNLEKNGIQYFGTPDPEDLDNLCDVIATPVRLTLSDGTHKSGKLPLAFCGHHGVFKIPSDDSLAVVGRYSKYMPVIDMPHAGTEYIAEPDAIKQEWYRKLIDNGADVVIGAHPHVTQPAEAYHGHLIVYSVGNFIFDQWADTETRYEAPVAISLSLKGDDHGQLDKWLALGATCGAYHDDCLERAKKQGLTRLPLAFSYQITPADSTGHLTHAGQAGELDWLQQRMRWNAAVHDLKAPYSGK